MNFSRRILGMGVLRLIFIIIPFLLGFSACDRPIQNPETKDLIYNDIRADIEKLKQEVDALHKEVEKNKHDFENAQIRLGMREEAQSSYFNSLKDLQKREEILFYLTKKLKTRKLEATKEYLAAREAKKDWPDEDAYKAYKVTKRLNYAIKDWPAERRAWEHNRKPAATHTEAAPAKH